MGQSHLLRVGFFMAPYIGNWDLASLTGDFLGFLKREVAFGRSHLVRMVFLWLPLY